MQRILRHGSEPLLKSSSNALAGSWGEFQCTCGTWLKILRKFKGRSTWRCTYCGRSYVLTFDNGVIKKVDEASDDLVIPDRDFSGDDLFPPV